MIEEFATFALSISAASAIGSLASAVVTYLRAKRRHQVEVKLPDGNVVTFNANMSKKQIEESLKRISGSVRQSLHTD